jgi:glyoxylase-like metal-dependent hydrolase (beta-lactamase superfamily II)
MREVVPDVYLVEGLRGGNVYLLVSGEELALVDSGVAGDVDKVVAQLQEAGFALPQLKSIVLTHAHGDHVGGAPELVRRSGAQVLSHRVEAPFIERSTPMPAASVGKRVMNWLSDNIMFRLSPCRVDRLLDDGETIGASGGMQVIYTPGHTPGSMCLYHPERRILFCGDALFNANPITGSPGLQLPLRLVSWDNEQARHSVGKLSALAIDVLCCGHGDPIFDGAAEKMKALLGEAS